MGPGLPAQAPVKFELVINLKAARRAAMNQAYDVAMRRRQFVILLAAAVAAIARADIE